MANFGVRRSSHLNHGLSGSCFKSRSTRANLSSNTLSSVLPPRVQSSCFFFRPIKAQQSSHTCDENDEERCMCVYIHTINSGCELTKEETLG